MIRRHLNGVSAWILVAALMQLNGCGSSNAPVNEIKGATQTGQSDSGSSNTAVLVADEVDETSPATAPLDKTPEVIIRTNLGEIRVELDREKAPKTVENFLRYVDEGFYANTVFHFVTDGMIIGGGFTQDLKVKEPHTPIRHEGGNGLKNVEGTIAMVRLPDYVHSATSQFFFNLKDQPTFDFQEVPRDSSQDDEAKTVGVLEVENHAKKAESYGYCVFGRIISGLDIAKKIGDVEAGTKGEFVNTPSSPVIIESVTRVE